MIPDNGRVGSNNSNRTAKRLSALPIAGIVVAVSLLLSGLSIIASHYSVFAQQNMTQAGGGNATAAIAAGGGGNQSEVRMHLEEARTALQNNDIQGALTHLDFAMNILDVGASGGGGNATGVSTGGATTNMTNGGTPSSNSSPNASSLTGGGTTTGSGATAGSGVGTFGGGGGTSPSPDVSTIYGGTPSSGGGGSEANMTASTTGSTNSTG